MEPKYYPIHWFKGELPLYVTLFLFWLFSGLAIYPFGWQYNIAWALVLIGAIFTLKKSGVALLNKKYFIQADETGIAFRLGIFSKETKLIWDFIEDIDILLYEINFRIKGKGTVTSLTISALDKEEAKELKEFVYKSFHKFKSSS
jgi:hypothetical protein